MGQKDTLEMTSAQVAKERLIKLQGSASDIDALPKAFKEWKPADAKPVEPVTLSIEATLAQRGKRYGDFTDHARVCQELKETMLKPTTEGRGWQFLTPVQKQALEVIADKLARILTGDPNYDDNWIDLQGYAKLVQDRLPKETK